MTYIRITNLSKKCILFHHQIYILMHPSNACSATSPVRSELMHTTTRRLSRSWPIQIETSEVDTLEVIELSPSSSITMRRANRERTHVFPVESVSAALLLSFFFFFFFLLEPSSGFFCDDIGWWSCHDRGLRRPQHDRDRRWVQVGMLTSAWIGCALQCDWLPSVFDGVVSLHRWGVWGSRDFMLRDLSDK